MDLSKCFDTLDHEIILKSTKKLVTDGSILNLVRMFLISGVMENGNWQASTEGNPQGDVISPLIANIYIDVFDQFMMSRAAFPFTVTVLHQIEEVVQYFNLTI